MLASTGETIPPCGVPLSVSKKAPFSMNPEPLNTVNGYWMPTIVAKNSIEFNREKLLEIFKNERIDGRVFFWPLSMLPMFKDQPEHVTSYELYKRAINLPSYHDLSEAEMDRVITTINKTLNSAEDIK